MDNDEGMERKIVIALRRIIRAIDRHSSDLVEKFGLTAPQLLVLQELSSLAPIATGELARRVHLAQATVSEILDRLEEQRLVARRRSEVDRRRVECSLDERGAELLRANPPLLQQRFASELGKLPDWERSFLLAALQKVAAMMDADELDAAPLLASGPLTASAEQTADFLKLKDVEPSS